MAGQRSSLAGEDLEQSPLLAELRCVLTQDTPPLPDRDQCHQTRTSPASQPAPAAMPNVPQHPPGITVRTRNRPGANLRRRTEPASANTLFYTALTQRLQFPLCSALPLATRSRRRLMAS